MDADAQYIYEIVKNGGESIECLKLNTKNFPNSARAHIALGKAYGMKEEKALAIRSFTRALELDPTNRDVMERIAKLK